MGGKSSREELHDAEDAVDTLQSTDAGTGNMVRAESGSAIGSDDCQSPGLPLFVFGSSEGAAEPLDDGIGNCLMQRNPSEEIMLHREESPREESAAVGSPVTCFVAGGDVTPKDFCMPQSDPSASPTSEASPSECATPSEPAAPSRPRKSGGESSAYYKGSVLGAKAGAIHCKGFATRQELTHCNRGLVVAMVGLPGRGKSFISRKLETFLKWQCMQTKTFNVGKYRRDVDTGTDNARADFFDSSNVAASEARRQSANLALNDLMDFLDGGGQVAILDATNSTNERRQMIVNRVTESGRKYRVLFVEVVCTDTEVLMTNMKNKVLHSPDFAGMSFEEGLADLMERVRKYEERYETIEDDSMSYIKLFNMSSKVLVNRIYGSIAQSLMPYMMGIHIGTRPIWLVRAGSVPVGKTQAAHLTESGRTFARKVGVFLERRLTEHFEGNVPDKPVRVLSSTVSSAVQTVLAMLNTTKKSRVLSFKQTSALNPIDRGKLSGSWWIDLCTHKPPFDELARRDPATFAKWQGNTLRTRFPGGESYYDVMIRASSVLLEIEMATRPVLCVSHMTLLQVLLSYFQGTDVADAWDISIPENCVIEITPTLGGSFGVEVIPIDNEVLDAPNMRPSKSRRRLSRDSYRSEEDRAYFSQDDSDPVRKCNTLTAEPLLFRRSVTPEASYQPHSEDDVFEKQRTISR